MLATTTRDDSKLSPEIAPAVGTAQQGRISRVFVLWRRIMGHYKPFKTGKNWQCGTSFSGQLPLLATVKSWGRGGVVEW